MLQSCSHWLSWCRGFCSASAEREFAGLQEGVPVNAPTGSCIGECDSCLPEATLSAMLPGTDGHWCPEKMKHNTSCQIRCPGAFKHALPSIAERGQNNTLGSGELTCWDGVLFTSIHCIEYLCPRNLFEGLKQMTPKGSWMVSLATFWYTASYIPLGALVFLHHRSYTAAAQRISELHAKID